MRRLVFGCGYLGSRVAQRWADAGDTVWVTTRDESRAKTLSSAGYRTIVCDVTKPDTLAALPQVDTLLFAIGYDRTSEPSIEEVYVDGLQNVIDRALVSDRFIYISSTGVYGNNDGELVEESATCDPVRPGGIACLAAEQRLQSSPLHPVTVVLRLAGIYGPERIPNLKALRSGKPIVAPEGSFLNLIHVDDAGNGGGGSC